MMALEPVWQVHEPAWRRARAYIDDVLAATDGDGAEPRLAAERAVAHAFWATCTDSDAERARSLAAAQVALEQLADGELTAALHGGAVGVAWCVSYVLRCVGDAALQGRADDLLAEVDEAIAAALSADDVDWHEYGILRGLGGVGLYAIERADARLIQCVVDVLERAAVTDEPGRTFHIPSAHTNYPDHFAGGQFNLGLSHGIAGALSFLASAHDHVPSASLRELIEDVVRWLLARERPDGHSAFPAIAVPGGRDLESDAGWAHGDAGVAFAIVAAGVRLHRPDWIHRGEGIAQRSLARPVSSYIQSYATTITHGCAGMAQIYTRLGQAFGAPCYREGARVWLGRMLEQLSGAPGEPGLPHLCNGALGNVLVLMTALCGAEPSWDACLGLRW